MPNSANGNLKTRAYQKNKAILNALFPGACTADNDGNGTYYCNITKNSYVPFNYNMRAGINNFVDAAISYDANGYNNEFKATNGGALKIFYNPI